MLEVIKSGYSTFQENTIRESMKLPSSLEPDLNFYDSALCQHLGVAKQEVQIKQNLSVSKGGVETV